MEAAEKAELQAEKAALLADLERAKQEHAELKTTNAALRKQLQTMQQADTEWLLAESAESPTSPVPANDGDEESAALQEIAPLIEKIAYLTKQNAKLQTAIDAKKSSEPAVGESSPATNGAFSPPPWPTTNGSDRSATPEPS
jgi:hypothetical protein